MHKADRDLSVPSSRRAWATRNDRRAHNYEGHNRAEPRPNGRHDASRVVDRVDMAEHVAEG